MATPLSLNEIRSKMRTNAEEMNKKMTESFKNNCGDETIDFINECLKDQKTPIMVKFLPECADKFYEYPKVVEKFLQQAYPNVVEKVEVYEKEEYNEYIGARVTEYYWKVRFDLSK
jgi:hypothetical protein